MNREKILIVDSDLTQSIMMAEFLIQNEYEVATTYNAVEAERMVVNYKPNLIVVEAIPSGIDGLTFCRKIRNDFTGIIIMLGNLISDIDEVTGLEVGANNYLIKPVQPRVLLAHIRALVRCRNILLPKNSMQVGELILDISNRSVKLEGKEIMLTIAEFDLLQILVDHRGQAISREELHRRIFNVEFDGFDRSIDLRVSRLRKKFSKVIKNRSVIRTVRNKGYFICN